MSYFNSNLPFIRKKKGISQTELAEKIGVDQSTISLWEKGMDTTVDNAIKVAEVLNVSIPDFLGKDLRFDNAKVIDVNSDIIKIPVYGTIKAGIPIESQTDIIDYVDIPRSWTKGGKEFYGLKVSGDSMFPKYQDEDIVIFEKTDDTTLYNGKDCAVMINGTESTFKKVLINDQGIVLQAYNMAYGIKMYSKEDVINKPIKIVGIAREKRTKID